MRRWTTIAFFAAALVAPGSFLNAQPAGQTPPAKQAQLAGASIRYTLLPAAEASRDKTPIIFVHGWASSRTAWKRQFKGLAGRRTMLALDLPGSGDSDDVAAEHTMNLYADAIAKVMDDAHIAKAVLVGHSNGVPAIRQFYRRYSQRVAALVTVEGALKRVFPPELAAPFLEQMEGENYLQFAENFLAPMKAAIHNEEDLALIRDIMLATPQRVMVGGFKAALADEIWTDDPINVPLLVVNAKSPFWNEQYIESLKALAPDMEYHTFTGVSHYLMMDEPEKFNNTLLAFLTKHGL